MASVLKVDKLDPQSGTALEIGTSGDTISVPSGATLDISSATLTPPATMPASSGVNLTALNATNLGSGTVPTARLGTGTASSSVFLAGDNTWAAPSGGKILQVEQTVWAGASGVTGTTYAYASPMTRGLSALASTSSRVYIIVDGGELGLAATTCFYKFYGRAGSDAYASLHQTGMEVVTSGSAPSGMPLSFSYLWSPSTTDTIDVQLWCKSSDASLAAQVNTADNQVFLTVMEIGG